MGQAMLRERFATARPALGSDPLFCGARNNASTVPVDLMAAVSPRGNPLDASRLLGPGPLSDYSVFRRSTAIQPFRVIRGRRVVFARNPRSHSRSTTMEGG
jgi:hypothetical protein